MTNTNAISTVKPSTNWRVNWPAGMARVRVRGLAASSSASAQRLNAMAQERADTIATRIQPSVRHEGQPCAANNVAVKANGRAKMECSHLIISSVVRVFASKPIASISISQCNGGHGPRLLERNCVRRRRASGSGFGLFDRRCEGKNAIDPGDFKEIHYAVIRSCNKQLGALRLATNVMVHDETHACRVHIGHTGKVNDGKVRRRGAAQFRLQLEKIAQCQRSGKAVDPGCGAFAFLAVDRQWSVSEHG